jgi:ABC-type xylose transport system permease subunit
MSTSSISTKVAIASLVATVAATALVTVAVVKRKQRQAATCSNKGKSSSAACSRVEGILCVADHKYINEHHYLRLPFLVVAASIHHNIAFL